MRKSLVLGGSLVIASMFLASSALAVPSFSRKYELACGTCHKPWPNLNAFGRTFKENGYRLDDGGTAPDHLMEVDEKTKLEALTFISGKVNGRLYDKKDSDDEFKLRPIHEVEVMLAGHAGNNFSYFIEIEAEDEEDFEVEVSDAAVGWHPRSTANVVLGYGSLFFVDPYNSLVDGGRRMTRSNKAPLDSGFEGASFDLGEPTQFVSFYGRVKRLYYSATVGTGNSDPEGGDEKDFALRVAYDFPVVSVGGFFIDGSTTDGLGLGMDADWSRAGIDFQVEKGGFVAYGMWMQADGDENLAPVVELSNDAAYVEALYLFEKNGNPRWYPLVRWETVDSNDGADSTDAVALLVGGFLRANININVEYWKETSVPTGLEKEDRVTVFFNVAF